uniref:Uncharacterized protein n=1 Tax=Kalanchoe fedtschenkoi TaxID=63787 RepID=A0A7N0T4V4_KALFE
MADGLLLFLKLLIISLALPKSVAQSIKSARLLDLVIRDYTVRSNEKHFRTGLLHNVRLPTNLSGIEVFSARFRCGSLHRYGANVKEFRLSPGVEIHPCVKRVLLVRQDLGLNFSTIYYDNCELYGYQLYTPILGLLAYNVGKNENPFELKLSSGATPFTVDFRNVGKLVNNTKGLIPLCASFETDGKVTLSNLVSTHLCVATRHGHYSLVIESPSMPVRNKKVSGWKMGVGVSMGGLIGLTLLVLLLTAMLVRVKKRSRMEELERRAYEEEALQVSMVGHVRAPTAHCTRTLPTLEHEFRSNPKHY